MPTDLKEDIAAWYLEEQYSYQYTAVLANLFSGYIFNALRNYFKIHTVRSGVASGRYEELKGRYEKRIWHSRSNQIDDANVSWNTEQGFSQSLCQRLLRRVMM